MGRVTYVLISGYKLLGNYFDPMTIFDLGWPLVTFGNDGGTAIVESFTMPNQISFKFGLQSP